MRLKPLVLLILDGWGVAPPSRGNAISQARTPHLGALVGAYPAMALAAAGEAVGLTRAQPGDSIVGYRTIGAGLLSPPLFPRINRAISDGTFFRNRVLLRAVSHIRRTKRRLHLVGLVSSGGVHSHLDHCAALLELARREGLEEVYVHAILDGRDAAHSSGAEAIAKLQEKMQALGVGRMATLVGRFYAMDRDGHWDRVAKAYRAMVNGEGERFTDDAVGSIRRYYQERVFDGELPPVVVGEPGAPTATIQSGDAVIFFNFRADRLRQLAAAITLPTFTAFDRAAAPARLKAVSLVAYDAHLPIVAAFPETAIAEPFTKVVSDAGLAQLHVAESEKYPLVTNVLNGGAEAPWPGEEDVIVPSPPNVSHATSPGMAAADVAACVVQAVLSERYDVIVGSFANADMVGHTGDLAATVAAVEAVDRAIGEVSDAVLVKRGLLLVTADHGKAEQLVDVQTGEVVRGHTANPVPFLAVANQLHGRTAGLPDVVGGDLSLLPPAGTLTDIAPTVLQLLGLPVPKAMTGKPLL